MRARPGDRRAVVAGDGRGLRGTAPGGLRPLGVPVGDQPDPLRGVPAVHAPRPCCGAAADRWSRKRCVVVADLVRAVAFGGVAVVGSFEATLGAGAAGRQRAPRCSGRRCCRHSRARGRKSACRRRRRRTARSPMSATPRDRRWPRVCWRSPAPRACWWRNGATFAVSAARSRARGLRRSRDDVGSGPGTPASLSSDDTGGDPGGRTHAADRDPRRTDGRLDALGRHLQRDRAAVRRGGAGDRRLRVLGACRGVRGRVPARIARRRGGRRRSAAQAPFRAGRVPDRARQPVHGGLAQAWRSRCWHSVSAASATGSS